MLMVLFLHALSSPTSQTRCLPSVLPASRQSTQSVNNHRPPGPSNAALPSSPHCSQTKSDSSSACPSNSYAAACSPTRAVEAREGEAEAVEERDPAVADADFEGVVNEEGGEGGFEVGFEPAVHRASKLGAGGVRGFVGPKTVTRISPPAFMQPHPVVESQLRRHFPAVTQHGDAMLVRSGRLALLRRLHRRLQQHDPAALDTIIEIDDDRLDGFALKIQLRRSSVREDTAVRRTVEHTREESRLVCQRCGEDGRRAGPTFTTLVSFTVCQECRDIAQALEQTLVWMPIQDDDDDD
ncbi:hypothetical protein HMN09_00992000 [Mycena chlorophos]|uniref:ClpX-type ZB domain-containing protein n=1 Tax=Mycena chlorophos TaxID=658473 RepID=A0A8H6SJC0_MYCCL|nr:hypothetical protein HMN09_00992000 [Mycena chlorophos]